MTVRGLGPGGEGKGGSRSFRVNIQEGFSEESPFELRPEGRHAMHAVQVCTAPTAADFYVYTSSVQQGTVTGLEATQKLSG